MWTTCVVAGRYQLLKKKTVRFRLIRDKKYVCRGEGANRTSPLTAVTERHFFFLFLDVCCMGGTYIFLEEWIHIVRVLYRV